MTFIIALGFTTAWGLLHIWVSGLRVLLLAGLVYGTPVQAG
jgi:hypothetical protein